MTLDFLLLKDVAEVVILSGGAVVLGIGAFKKSNRLELLTALTEARTVNSIHEIRIKALEDKEANLQLTLQQTTTERDSLRLEVKQLRDLIMLNQVPPALEQFVQGVAGKNHTAIEELKALIVERLPKTT